MKTYLVLGIILIVISYVTSVQFEDYDYDEESKYDHLYSSKSKPLHGDNKPQSRKYENHEHSSNADAWKKTSGKSYEDDYDEESKYDHLYPAQPKEEIDEKKPMYKIEDAPQLFNKFIKDFNKSYKDQEDYDKHYDNFVGSLKEINEINSSDATYETDINMFSDMGPEELAIFTGGAPTH